MGAGYLASGAVSRGGLYFFCDLMAAESLWCGGKETERAKLIDMFHRFAFDHVATGAPWRGKGFLLYI
jgi:hypothetical protein